MPDTSLIGSRETCALLSIDKSTLSRWVAADKLTPVAQMPGANGAMVFTRADVEALRESLKAAS